MTRTSVRLEGHISCQLLILSLIWYFTALFNYFRDFLCRHENEKPPVIMTAEFLLTPNSAWRIMAGTVLNMGSQRNEPWIYMLLPHSDQNFCCEPCTAYRNWFHAYRNQLCPCNLPTLLFKVHHISRAFSYVAYASSGSQFRFYKWMGEGTSSVCFFIPLLIQGIFWSLMRLCHYFITFLSYPSSQRSPGHQRKKLRQ